MAASSFTILLFTNDTTIQALVGQVFKGASVMIARDVLTFQKESSRHRFDAVVVESHGGQEQIGTLHDHLDPTRTLCISGSKAVLKKTL
ncbi:MAG: hypothetical protein WBK08_11785, partial [Nitrospira sp.]